MNLLANLRIFCLLLLMEGSLPQRIDLYVTPLSTPALDCLPGIKKSLFDQVHSWTRDRDPLPNTERVLYINQISREQEGTYECTTEATTDMYRVKLRRIFKVTVKDDAALDEVVLVETELGQNTELPCELPASPKDYNVAWYRDVEGKKVELHPRPVGEENGTIKVQWKSDWSIELHDVTVEDAGTYYCYWDRDVKKEHQTVELRVREPPTVPPPRCLAFMTPSGSCETGNSRSGRAILIESLNGFSMDLYSKLSKSDPSKNVLFSPISIAGVLAHLLLGARGTTHESLERALHLPSSFSCLHTELKAMREVLKGDVEVASQMYYSPELELNQDFVNQSVRFYGAPPSKFTNSSVANIKMINNWVAEKTNQRITEMVNNIPDETQLVLLNAVYFNGNWKMKFVSGSKEAPFITASGELVNVPVLYSPKYRLYMWYSSELEAQVAVFPLSGHARLFILLPESISLKNLQTIEDRMTKDIVDGLINKMDYMSSQLAEVTIPKIKLDISTDILDLLESMGLSELFNDPNLCGISSADMDPPLTLTDAQHRSFLSLTEKGVEAGGATSLSFSRSFQSFTALRPFVLMLWSDQAKIPLFLGRVMKP